MIAARILGSRGFFVVSYMPAGDFTGFLGFDGSQEIFLIRGSSAYLRRFRVFRGLRGFEAFGTFGVLGCVEGRQDSSV